MRRETAVLACLRQEPGAGDMSLPGPGWELPGAQGETCLLSSRLSGRTVLSGQRTSAPYSCLVTLGKSLPSSEFSFLGKRCPTWERRQCCREVCGARQSGCWKAGASFLRQDLPAEAAPQPEGGLGPAVSCAASVLWGGDN